VEAKRAEGAVGGVAEAGAEGFSHGRGGGGRFACG
jgi:hypothetical protein